MPGRASRSSGSPTGPRTPAWRRVGRSQQQWSFSFSPFLQSLMQSESFTHILRVLNTNVDGKEKIMYALTSIRGIGRRFSNICIKKAEVDLNRRCVALEGWRPLELACRSGGGGSSEPAWLSLTTRACRGRQSHAFLYNFLCAVRVSCPPRSWRPS